MDIFDGSGKKILYRRLLVTLIIIYFIFDIYRIFFMHFEISPKDDIFFKKTNPSTGSAL